MNVILSMQKDDVFGSHAPKEDTIKAVKLTKDNLRSVGAYILTVLGGPVSVSDVVTVGDLGLVSTFTVGDWVVEEFDYLHGIFSFRAATLDERKKYDLR